MNKKIKKDIDNKLNYLNDIKFTKEHIHAYNKCINSILEQVKKVNLDKKKRT